MERFSKTGIEMCANVESCGLDAECQNIPIKAFLWYNNMLSELSRHWKGKKKTYSKTGRSK